MPKFESLSIPGYRGEDVPHSFLRQEQPARRLAVLYPGIGYTAGMPLLYYPAQLLLARGADVLKVETQYIRRPEYRALSKEDQAAWVRADALAACQAALAQGTYERLTLVGKSLGTQAMGEVLAAGLDLPGQVDCVWLTPLLRFAEFQRVFPQGPRERRDLLVIGSADPHYDLPLLANALTVRNGESLVIPGADHSLELPGGVLPSLVELEKIMLKVEIFLA
jgi:hypothetical protein